MIPTGFQLKDGHARGEAFKFTRSDAPRVHQTFDGRTHRSVDENFTTRRFIAEPRR